MDLARLAQVCPYFCRNPEGPSRLNGAFIGIEHNLK